MTIEFDTSRLPILPGAIELARFGMIPEGRYTNEDYLFDKIRFSESVPLEIRDICYDPQTSGGLLLFMSPSDAKAFEREMGKDYCKVIGRVVEKTDRDVVFV